MKPYHDISFVAVAWNEERRAPALMKLARRWFRHLVVAVQESTDSTAKIVESFANRETDTVLHHPHLGTGDASMPGLVRAVQTPWAFVVAFDEWPSVTLLRTLGEAVFAAEQDRTDAYWIPFRSITEGVSSTDTQSGHLRLFRRELSWPSDMHSRPMGRRERWWRRGYITHERSLDEMMRDYLRYHELGRGNPGWEAHNRLMMHDACLVIGQQLGWDHVTRHEWWPEVRALAFAEEEEPWRPTPSRSRE